MKQPASIVAAVLGIQLTAAMSNIIGGELVKDGEAPFVVSIRKNGNHTCGGTLISDRLVLTTSHCITDVAPSSLTVVAGTNSLRQDGSSSGAVERNVSEGISHPDFNLFYYRNDIGIIKLAAPFPLSDTIRPIDMYLRNDVPPGTNASTYGWGYTVFPPSLSPTPKPMDLRVVGRPTMSTAACYEAYVGYGGTKNITERDICTETTGGQGTCYGDSGGPLVWTTGKGRRYLIGVVSFGVPCAYKYPDVYTKVSSYVEWIKGNSA